MTQRIAGPGSGPLPPANLYPSSILPQGQVNPQNTNLITLAAGDSVIIPAGEWYITMGLVSVYQTKDAVTGTWQGLQPCMPGERFYCRSDGVHHRVANLTGCPVAAVVTNGGTNYVQSSTSVTVTGGNSTWTAIVGGQLNTSSVSVTVAGSGYGQAPLAFIPAPKLVATDGIGGVQASAYAAISSTSVSALTVANQGAGYTGTSITVSVLPNPYDPNFLNGSITTQATALIGVTGAGKVTAVVCTNPGVAVAGVPTLTIAGAGASASATALWMNTVTAASVSVAGTGYGGGALITTTGGKETVTEAFTNPAIELTANSWVPRPFRAGVALNGVTISTVSIDDPGLFLSTSITVLVLGQANPTTIGTIALTQGSMADTIFIQPV